MIWVYNESPLPSPSETVKYKTKLSVFSQNSSPGCLPAGIIILYLKSHFISPCILFQSQVAATAPTQQTKGTKYHILLNLGPALSEHGNLGLFHLPQKLHIKIVWTAILDTQFGNNGQRSDLSRSFSQPLIIHWSSPV